MTQPPAHPKIYHIVHVDRLPSIIAEDCLWCDAEVTKLKLGGTNIGMDEIKLRRSNLRLPSYNDVRVGDCVPFHFCPRSIMLYIISRAHKPKLKYKGDQEPIVHLEADLYDVVEWATKAGRRWVFTRSNAGAYYFEDCCDLSRLDELNWEAINATDWRKLKDAKQAEFLLERSFPWELVERIGVYTAELAQRVVEAFPKVGHRPRVEVLPKWYY